SASEDGPSAGAAAGASSNAAASAAPARPEDRTASSQPSTGRGAVPNISAHNSTATAATQEGEGSQAPDERRNRFAERLKNMSPEEREGMTQRMRARGIDPASFGGGAGGRAERGAATDGDAGAVSRRRGGRTAPPESPAVAREQGATTID